MSDAPEEGRPQRYLDMLLERRRRRLLVSYSGQEERDINYRMDLVWLSMTPEEVTETEELFRASKALAGGFL